MRISSTTVEYADHPLGLDTSRPRLSWVLEADSRDRQGASQSAYQVLVATSPAALRPGLADVWDSGRVTCEDSVHAEYAGPRITARTRYFWTVRVWDRDGGPTAWAEPSWWESGLMGEAWEAAWIGHDHPVRDGHTARLRTEFAVGAPVRRARLYATALGLYEAELNGQRVGDDLFAPGWTEYTRRVQYQVHDVTRMIAVGRNALGVSLSPGWYAGHVCWLGQRLYGDRPWFRARLEIEFEDGTVRCTTTGPEWRASSGPVTFSDLLMGERYDARLETPGWSSPGFDAAAWTPALVNSEVSTEPVAQVDPAVRVTQLVRAVGITEPRPGVHVIDLGQNIVGAVRLRVSGRSGQTVTIRHAEVLNPDGGIHTENLRTAEATDTYTLRGGGEEVYEPRFTFHGFRYVELTGFPGQPDLDTVVGRVMHNDAPFTMEFRTNVPMLNRLQANITWGQRGNFLSVPTDTPARDERLGWSGDINVFCGTAAYNMDCARFLTKYLIDLRDAQSDDGGFTNVAPDVGGLGHGVAGWGDAGVTVPWLLYERYGDLRVLRESYPSMRRWIAYLESHSDGLIRPDSGYGDWLNVDDPTRGDLVGTAYFASSVDVVRDTARVLDLARDVARYEELGARVREAFVRAFVGEDARLVDETQTGYVLALSMRLLPERLRERAADRLVELIRARDWHLSTGFLGTPRLLRVLTACGRLDVAYRLLHQTTFPSWGYPIERGATTMWERWDGIRPDGSWQDLGMNSFNHYAYGCVGEWMYQTIAGLSPLEPGFARVLIAPRPGGEVTSCSARYDSVRGSISVEWQRDGDAFSLRVSVPPTVRARVLLPNGRHTDVGSGSYEFACSSSRVRGQLGTVDAGHREPRPRPAPEGAVDE